MESRLSLKTGKRTVNVGSSSLGMFFVGLSWGGLEPGLRRCIIRFSVNTMLETIGSIPIAI
jgi:hypothetical protein